MIGDPNIEYEDKQEVDEDGELIYYIEDDPVPEEFTPYEFDEDTYEYPDSYYENVWDDGTNTVALLADEATTTGEDTTDGMELEDESSNPDITEEEGKLNEAQEAYEEAQQILIDILTSALAKGEITSEDNAEIVNAQGQLAFSSELIKDLCNTQSQQSISDQIKELKDNMVSATVDDILDILTEEGTKPWIYKDEDNNVLIDGTSIPELTILAKKLNLIATDGDNESELQLTPEFMKLISDKLILEAKKIELNGTININDGAFIVGSTGRTRIGGLTGHVINGYNRAQLDISSLGTLYSVSLTTEDLYAQLSEGYIKFVNGNQTSKVTAAGIDTTSDIRLKENITPIDDRFKNLMLDICPIQYNMKDDRNIINRKNIGFSAQQVESLMNDYGIDYNEFAALNKNEDGIYSLNYNEFIPLNTHMIQILYKKIIELQKRIEELEKK